MPIDDEYERYVNLVLADCLPFYQISPTVYVVQGWNQKNEPTSHWFHLQRKRIGKEWVVACFCPSSVAGPCVHHCFAQDHGEERFPDDGLQLNSDTDEVILFSRQAAHDNIYFNHFSVVFAGQTSVKNRVVVSFSGDDTGLGKWVCQKDQGNICGHIQNARHGLQKLIQVDPTARDEMVRDEPTVVIPLVRGAAAHSEKAISHLPIHAPVWASLPDDCPLYPRPLPLQSPPPILNLDERSSCMCSMLYNPFMASEERACTIYMTTQGYSVKIQLQRCPTCPHKYHRFIGPEPRNLGLFNFNNQLIFTHALLDEYTSAFTSSETPFAAWVVTVSRRY